MKKGKRGEKSFPSSGIGEILAQSLTMDQIAHLLDVVFAAEDTGLYSNEFKKADPDMAKTVERVLAMNSGEIKGPQSGRLASNQRILEHWNSLWERWDTIVLDVGDEEGEYAVQDAHWEKIPRAVFSDGYGWHPIKTCTRERLFLPRSMNWKTNSIWWIWIMKKA